MLLDDLRKALEGAVGTLTPAKAQQLAKDMMEPGAAKEQVAKTTADLMEWSMHNRERIREFVGREIQHQMQVVGVATQADVDALKKRVRELERAAGMTASGRKKTTARKKPAARKTTAKAAPKKAPASGPASGAS